MDTALVELSLDHMFNNPISHLVHFVYINTLIQIVLIFLRNEQTNNSNVVEPSMVKAQMSNIHV